MITPGELDSVDEPRRLYDLASEAVENYRAAAEQMAKVRARAIAALVAEGYSHKDLASTLDISGPRISQLLSGVDEATVQVLKAWARLERLLADVAQMPDASSGAIYSTAVRALRSSGRIDEDTLSNLDNVRRIRNRVIHGHVSVSLETAEEVRSVASVVNAKLVLWLQEEGSERADAGQEASLSGMQALISIIDADRRHDELQPEVEVEYEVEANPRHGRDQVWAVLHNYSNRPYRARIRAHWAPNSYTELGTHRLDALGDTRIHIADANSNLPTHLAIEYDADGWQLCPCDRPAEGHWKDHRAINLRPGTRRPRSRSAEGGSRHTEEGSTAASGSELPDAPIATVARTGQRCPQSGIWEVIGDPATTASIAWGERMPPVRGATVKWRLVQQA